MARARNLKPGLFKNEILGVADPLYTLLFQGLWVLADREGRLEDRPLRIKAEVFPYRDGLKMDEMLNWLAANGFIVRYEVDGVRYIEIRNFAKHQNPHKNEAASEIPPPPIMENQCVGSTSEKIGSARADSLYSDSLYSDSGFPQHRVAQHSPDATPDDDEPKIAEAKPAKIKPTFDWETGKIVGLPDAVIDKWQEAYPAVNVRAEIAKAEAWQLANPKNRKGDYVRFLNNWLMRQQDRAPRVGGGGGYRSASQIPLSERNRIAAEQHIAALESGEYRSSWIPPDDDKIIDMEAQA